MKRRTPSDNEQSSAVAPYVILCAAVVVSVPAIFSAVGFWNKLPQQQVRNVTSDEIRTAFAKVNRSLPAQAREGLALLQAGNTFTDILTDRVSLEQARPSMVDTIGVVTNSQLGRIQLAALHLLTLERGSAPPEQLWPVLRVYLEGIERADFEHDQQALIRQWCPVYEAVGLSSGTAYQLAEDAVGHPHGTLLQYFVPRLRKCITQCDAAGDHIAAQKCRTLLGNLLRQWILQDGAPGLQLLAADLLADFLENDSVGTDDAARKAVASELREWQREYRQAVSDRALNTLAPFSRPAPAPEEHTELVKTLTRSIWFGSAALTSCLTAIVFTWAMLRQYLKTKRCRAFDIHGMIAALTLVIGGLMLFYFFRADTICPRICGAISRLCAIGGNCRFSPPALRWWSYCWRRGCRVGKNPDNRSIRPDWVARQPRPG